MRGLVRVEDSRKPRALVDDASNDRVGGIKVQTTERSQDERGTFCVTSASVEPLVRKPDDGIAKALLIDGTPAELGAQSREVDVVEVTLLEVVVREDQQVIHPVRR